MGPRVPASPGPPGPGGPRPPTRAGKGGWGLTLHTRVPAHQEGGPLQRGGGGLCAGHDHVENTGHHVGLGKQAVGVFPLQGGLERTRPEAGRHGPTPPSRRPSSSGLKKGMGGRSQVSRAPATFWARHMFAATPEQALQMPRFADGETEAESGPQLGEGGGGAGPAPLLLGWGPQMPAGF